MDKRTIEETLQQNDSTVLSFPSRGEWGSNRYRGNCSGWIQAFLIWKYQVKKLAELFAGSGTGSDIARDMGIGYVGADLNPNPVRDNILSVDAVKDDVPEEFLGADMVFMHPPYGLEIGIPYAGSMWKDTTDKELKHSDLGQMQWDKFMRILNMIVMKYYAAMDTGSRMSILMGDVRRKGVCHSMLKDIVQPGQLDQIFIKTQHNCQSDGRTYAKKSFVPIVHEYIMVIKKLMPYIIDFSLPTRHEKDIRDSKTATWRDVVRSVLEKLGEDASLSDIYKEIEGHEKAKNNENWQAKVRQTLQINSCFTSNARGVWAMAA